MSTQPQTEQRTIAQTILDEIYRNQSEIEQLRRFAEKLALPIDGETESFMEAVLRLLGLMVAGTEETHSSLRALHTLMTAPGFAGAMREAMNDN